MATQDDAGIPVTYYHNQQGVRLLELPPELVNLFDSGSAPRLQIKSSKSTTQSNGASHAVLTTPTQTYALRQVQSSNSIFIATTATYQASAFQPPTSSLRLSATASSTLEVLPSSSDSSTSPQSCLRSALSLYDQDEYRSSDIIDNDRVSKQHIFADIPLSETECEAAWTALVAFEYDRKCLRPSARTATECWTGLLEHVKARTQHDAVAYAIDDDDIEMEGIDWPPALVQALVRRVSKRQGDGEQELDVEKVVPWTGELVMHTQTDAGELGDSAHILERWRSLLPERWREKVTLEDAVALGERWRASNGDLMSRRGGELKTKPGARNWHERLKRAK